MGNDEFTEYELDKIGYTNYLTQEEMNMLKKEDRNLRLNDAAKVFWEIPSFE